VVWIANPSLDRVCAPTFGAEKIGNIGNIGKIVKNRKIAILPLVQAFAGREPLPLSFRGFDV
jgi:hypothetical protein